MGSGFGMPQFGATTLYPGRFGFLYLFMIKRYRKLLLFAIPICLLAMFWLSPKSHPPFQPEIGQPIDSLNGVYVFYNGKVGNVSGRHLTEDRYNLGLKYQCVEFVKRYYYQYLNHRMPNTYGHAKDFFDNRLKDGKKNADRALIQYRNPSQSKPQLDDLLVMGPSNFNEYGHVAIIASVSNYEIEIIQQNPGIFGPSRKSISLTFDGERWAIKHSRILGWLRKE